MASIREASHAGSWYSAGSNKLSRELDQWLAAVPDQITPIHDDGEAYTPPVSGARVIIAPHAGYSYSGPAAAWAYKSLDLSKAKRIFLLGPSHAWYLDDCAISSHTHYETPLGNFTLDRTTIDELNNTGKFRAWPKNKEELEHSLEMHLPYLYKTCSQQFKSEADFPLLIPVLVGNIKAPKAGSSNSPKDEVAYGKLFSTYLEDPSSVFVISSDFCHWGDRFQYQTHMPQEVDESAMKAIETGDHQNFTDDLHRTKNTVCGRHPIGIAMAALEELRKKDATIDGGIFKFIRYERSSEIKSKRDSSVSYCSAIAMI